MSFVKVNYSRNAQAGVGLIEVLISLFTLAVGLLGILGLQVNALGSNQRATFTTEAQFAAADIVNRMAVYGENDVGANGGEFVMDSNAGTYTDPGCINATAGCTQAQQINYDQWQWGALLENSLPAGRGIVTWDAPVYTVTVLWDQDRTGATGIDCDSRDTLVNLTCFTMELRM